MSDHQIALSLPPDEKHQIVQLLDYYEAIVERGMKTFIEVGNALMAIRDGRLYKEKGHETFEGYCRERWGMARNYANKMIAAVGVVKNLGTVVPILPTHEGQVRPLTRLSPDQQREAWAQAVESAPLVNGKPRVTGAHVERVMKEASQPVRVTIFSHGSEEYYTPPEYVEAAREVMGSLDLDPASCEAAQEWIQASQFYVKDDDGLQRDWHGKVWLNPPYSKTNGKSNQATWSQKLISEYQSGRVTEAILLIKAALGYKWFENFWCDWPVCFARERLSFIKSDGSSDGQSKQGTAFFYFGENPERFREIFSQFGRVIMPDG